MQIITNAWRSRWSSDEIRVLVLASLVIQIGLIFLAPLRKRSTNQVLMLMLWLFYLTADYVATLALGNIISNQTYPSGIADSKTIPGELTALWAPFLLLHLGGPDSITSYSIEDNELWWRHLLGLVVQVIIAALVFLQTPSNPGLWIPTILVFIPGLIKFVERTIALRSGSKENLKDRIISELGPVNETKVDFISTSSDTSKSESEFILEGYGWFNIFKSLLVDVTFSLDLLIQSQDRFSDISSREAFKLVAIELSFLYDFLHTKAVHIHCISGRLLRCTSLLSMIAALIVFHHLDKQKYSSTDIIVTYILFGAALSLEVIASILLLFSDWTVVSLRRRAWWKYFAIAITAMVKATSRSGKPRWSNIIGQYNLIGLCLRDGKSVFARIMRKLKVRCKWYDLCETKVVPLPQLLEDIMHMEAKRRAQNVHLYNVLIEARSYRGSKALERHGQQSTLGWSMKKEFDECIILWHIATDICFHIDTPDPSNGNETDPSNRNESERIVSLKMCNYMVYLLTQQPSMLQLGYGKTRFEATCAMVKKIFNGQEKLDDKKARLLLDEKTKDPGNLIEGDEKGGLVLVDGCRLARELQELNTKLRWQLISEAWVEMLGYAAIHCESSQHARSVSRGGELLTHFWLLLAQMGIVEEHKMQQFQSVSV